MNCVLSYNPVLDSYFTDFETAAPNATRTVFECQMKGRKFHFRQAVWKCGKNYGLRGFRLFTRRAFALPLSRLCDIEDLWLYSLEQVDLHIVCLETNGHTRYRLVSFQFHPHRVAIISSILCIHFRCQCLVIVSCCLFAHYMTTNAPLG